MPRQGCRTTLGGPDRLLGVGEWRWRALVTRMATKVPLICSRVMCPGLPLAFIVAPNRRAYVVIIRTVCGQLHKGELVQRDPQNRPVIRQANGFQIRGDEVSEPTACLTGGAWSVAFPPDLLINYVPASNAEEAIELARLTPEYKGSDPTQTGVQVAGQSGPYL